MPPHTTTGRPFNTSTRMGKLMVARGLRVRDVGHGAQINDRQISDYLAGRKIPTARQQARLVAYFKVPPEKLFDFHPNNRAPKSRQPQPQQPVPA